MPTLKKLEHLKHYEVFSSAPDDGVEEALDGGVPGEGTVLDLLVAGVVLPGSQHHHRHCPCHQHPCHHRLCQLNLRCLSVTQVSTSGGVPAKASLSPTWFVDIVITVCTPERCLRL